MTLARRPQPTMMVWHRHLERAEFEEFLWHAGRAQFRGQHPTEAERFRKRVWPVFWRIRRPRQTTDAWQLSATPMWMVAFNCSLDKAIRLRLQRRVLVARPLERQWDRIDEAIAATRGTCA